MRMNQGKSGICVASHIDVCIISTSKVLEQLSVVRFVEPPQLPRLANCSSGIDSYLGVFMLVCLVGHALDRARIKAAEVRARKYEMIAY